MEDTPKGPPRRNPVLEEGRIFFYYKLPAAASLWHTPFGCPNALAARSACPMQRAPAG